MHYGDCGTEVIRLRCELMVVRVFLQGCRESMVDLLKQNVSILIGVISSVAMLQVSAKVFSCLSVCVSLSVALYLCLSLCITVCYFVSLSVSSNESLHLQ